MKIGILTYQFANNYGAVLQTYSFSKVLREMGFDVEVINFRTQIQNSHHSLFEDSSSPRNIVKNIIRLPHIKERKKRIDKFDEFRRLFINMSREKISNKVKLIEMVEERYDMIFVGSDQVWNPCTYDFDNIYYEIVDTKIPVVTYAASMGNALQKDIIPYINSILKFKKVSIRETSGVDLLLGFASLVKCVSVMDPTLLLSEKNYREIANRGKKITSPYVLCYYLGRKNSLQVEQIVRKVAKDLKLQAYFINANNGVMSYGKNKINDAGPCDFLSLIAGAKIVFTNSFHATVFSIKLGVSFYNFEKFESKDYRKKDLLRQFGINNRTIIDYQLRDDISIENKDILEAKKKINNLVLDSIKYIQNCVDDLV